MKIALVACCKSKRPGLWPAKDLYVSDLFRLSVQWVIQQKPSFDQWFILSARHGLVLPNQILQSYNESLNDKSDGEIRVWSQKVVRSLAEFRPTEVYILAGRSYCQYLIFGLVSIGVKVTEPMKGMPIGKRLQFLHSELVKISGFGIQERRIR